MRNNRPLSAGGALLLAAFWACSASVSASAHAADLITSPADNAERPSSCDKEAVLLARRIEVRAAPNPDSAATIVLTPGTSIYRCEQRGAFLRVMFPEEGGKVDCSIRPPSRICPMGWTDAPFEVEITD